MAPLAHIDDLEATSATRREELYVLHRPLLREIFNPDGTAAGPGHDLGDPRVRAWHSYPALSGNEEDIALGNAILRQSNFSPSYDFGMCGLLHAYLRWPDRFEPDVRQHAEDAIAQAGPPQVAESSGFVGMNDNFGAMAAMVAILCGERNGNQSAVDWALTALRDFTSRLDSHGTKAEFNSPTYTGITLLCMAELVEYASTAEACELARRIEEQIWYDSCARFHPGTGIQGGPTSRSYMLDSCGHLSSIQMVYAVAFPKLRLPGAPNLRGYGKEPLWTIHHASKMYMAAAIAWRTVIDYHPPQACTDMMSARTLPDEVVGTAACATRWVPDDWRSHADGRDPHRFRKFRTVRYGDTLLTTYHADDYTLGTSSGALACGTGGQQDGFFLAYRRRQPSADAPLQPEDLRTAFARYAYNDRLPQLGNKSDLFAEEGTKTAVQSGGTALVLYRPGDFDISNITSMRLSILLPLHCSKPDALWIGDRHLPELEGECDEAQPVWLEDGLIRVMFCPLTLTRYHSQGATVRVRTHGNFLMIDFLNYEGPARNLNFHQQAMRQVQNGFVCHVATTAEDTSMDAFRARLSQHELSDEIDATGLRQVAYSCGDTQLSIAYDPWDLDNIPVAQVNGKPRETPRFRCGAVAELPV